MSSAPSRPLGRGRGFAGAVLGLITGMPVRTRYVNELLAGDTGPRGTNLNMRWIASMVADVHI